MAYCVPVYNGSIFHGWRLSLVLWLMTWVFPVGLWRYLWFTRALAQQYEEGIGRGQHWTQWGLGRSRRPFQECRPHPDLDLWSPTPSQRINLKQLRLFHSPGQKLIQEVAYVLSLANEKWGKVCWASGKSFISSEKKPEEENLLFPLYMSYDYRLLWVELYSPQIHTRTLTLSTSKHDHFWGFSA